MSDIAPNRKRLLESCRALPPPQHVKFMGSFPVLIIAANEERIIARYVRQIRPPA